MGVNNISHYNYSHTATPIHHQQPPPPHFTLFLPPFSICLYSPIFLPLLYNLIMLFTSFSFIHFHFLSILSKLYFLCSVYININPLVSGLRSLNLSIGWSDSAPNRRNMKLRKLEKNTTNVRTSAFSLECCLNAVTTAKSNNNLGKFLELFTAWERYNLWLCKVDLSCSRSLWTMLNA